MMKRAGLLRGVVRLATAVALVAGPIVGPAAATVYQWTTPEGVIGLTDDPGRIPDRYRATAKPYGTVTTPPSSKQAPAPAAKPQPSTANTTAAEPTPPVDHDGHDRAWWQDRVQELKDQRADLVRQREEAEKKFNEIHYFGRQTYGELQLAQTLRQQADDLAKQISALDQQLTSGLAEEARKAGAPIGWVRD